MRSAYPDRKHKNQLQEHFNTIYSACKIIKHKILYRIHAAYKINKVCYQRVPLSLRL